MNGRNYTIFQGKVKKNNHGFTRIFTDSHRILATKGTKTRREIRRVAQAIPRGNGHRLTQFLDADFAGYAEFFDTD
jgi:hypothetical protein